MWPVSRREAEILSLLACGMQKEKIAERIELTLATVRTHCQHIREKLGATTMAQAVATAINMGFIVIESE